MKHGPLYAALLALGLLAPLSHEAWASPRGGHGHGHVRSSVGIYVGGPYWGGYWGDPFWYGPRYGWPYSPYYYDPFPRTVVIEREPPVYIQREQVQTAPAAPAASVNQPSLWYYCPKPAGYYPYVPKCDQAWIPVDPRTVPPQAPPR